MRRAAMTSARITTVTDNDNEDGVWMAYLEEGQDDLLDPKENDKLDDKPAMITPHPSTPLNLYLCCDFDPFTYALGHNTRIETIDETIGKSKEKGEGCDDLHKAMSIDKDNSSVASNAPTKLEVTSVTAETDGSTVELYDSGCSRHMSAYKHLFTSFQTIEPKPICAADQHVFNAIGKGNI